ncbi:hypothetical protein [Streptomyces sp. NPDC058623]|uniref:hypothetical protein n=1 Tax=Streptomyces sp. NPDC058623 TaxID=3346563 RepID=UPI0036667FB5
MTEVRSLWGACRGPGLKEPIDTAHPRVFHPARATRWDEALTDNGGEHAWVRIAGTGRTNSTHGALLIPPHPGLLSVPRR